MREQRRLICQLMSDEKIQKFDLEALTSGDLLNRLSGRASLGEIVVVAETFALVEGTGSPYTLD